MTTFEYDADGRMVRAVTVREPEFDDAERALLIASRRRVIGDHGIALEDAMNPENQFAFVAPSAPKVDWADKALRDRMDAYYASRPKGESRNGHRWGGVTFNA